jgi:predicted dehydrogenase
MTMGRPITPVGLGIVGAGSAGRQHLAAVTGCADVAPVAVCDPDPSALADLAARAPGDVRLRTVPALDELLDDSRIELVAVATPPGNHAALALQVLASGRAVLLEKPPTLTVDELDAVVADADRRGLAAGVMLQHRFRIPPPALARSFGADAVGNVEVVRYRPYQHYARAAWRTDVAASGGGLIAHLGVHYLDLACQVLGMPTGMTGTVDAVPDTAIDQRVAFTTQFASGARLSFIGTTAVDRRSERLAVYGDRRALVVSEECTTYTVDTRTTHPAPPTHALRTAAFADMAHAVRERRRPGTVDLRSARGVVRLLELVHAARPASAAA